MKVKLANGTEAEISTEEAKRIAGEMHNEPHTYLARAQDNLEMLTGKRPETEDDLKEILYNLMPGIKREDADAIYEVIEAAIGRFASKSM